MTPAREVRIGLWGATSSGKTTFLAALRIATLEHGNNGDWRITASDDASSRFLSTHTTMLTAVRGFPASTQKLPDTAYRWLVEGTPAGGLLARVVRTVQMESRVSFEIEVMDCPGSVFADDAPDADPAVQAVLAHMASSHALVFLFDPTAEGTAFSFFQRMLDRLMLHARNEGVLTPSHNLPHSLALSVTKFDDPRVFEPARRGGWVAQAPDGGARMPEVPPERSRDFIETLLELRQRDRLLLGSIRSHFDSDAVGYFVTTAVGFRVGPHGQVDLDDYANVQTIDREPRILGDIAPINVVEPLIWLERSIRQRRREGAIR